ncbi:TPA: hypothetical protein RG830_000415 [Vibrio vulnificus]|nr:hypothetical protein [Vibrio vulnificus]HDU8764716.1 hypothetical protein [Vibrio vulnificus]
MTSIEKYLFIKGFFKMINFRPSKVNAAVIFCMLTTPAMAFANTGACIYEQGIDKIRDGIFEQQENGGGVRRQFSRSQKNHQV